MLRGGSDVPQEHNASWTAGERLVENVIEATVDVPKQEEGS